MQTPLTAAEATEIYDILVVYAGAPEAGRADFVFHQTDRYVSEYRFQGDLGFGGKFWRSRGTFYVSAYPEDVASSLERRQIIDRTNMRLAHLAS